MEVPIFLSYAPEDIEHRDALVRHLEPLRRSGRMRLWHDGLAAGGDDRDELRRSEMERAAVVLLLVSADYLGSEACRAEMERALERSRREKARVVPVLLRPCLLGFDRIAKLQCLPADGRPVTVWPDRDSAWTDVANGIAGLADGDVLDRAAAALTRGEAERLRLLAKLEDAQVRRRRLESAHATTGDVDAEILKLKRDLREGGQVQQGDILRARYTLLRRVGRGGFGTVWEAEDREERTRVAVKILHPDLAGDTQRRERFFRGARIMSELRHPAIVRILVPEQQDAGFHYFVMEHMAGGDLHEAVLEGRVPPERVVPLIARVGEALTAAHEHPQRFIHRDVKPANVLLDDSGEPKLGDFDLVGGMNTTGGTHTGAMGSFVYAAPEMLSRPQGADARADVFGLGMTALFCLHGKALTEEAFFDPKGLLDELGRPVLAAVIAKAIERKAQRRFADVRSFCAALQAAEDAERLASTEQQLSAPPPALSPSPSLVASPSTVASQSLTASPQLSPSPPPSSAVQALALPPRADPSSKLDAAPENRSAPAAERELPAPPASPVPVVPGASSQATPPVRVEQSRPSYLVNGAVGQSAVFLAPAKANPDASSRRLDEDPTPHREPTEKEPTSGARGRGKVLAMAGGAVLAVATGIYGVVRGFSGSTPSSGEGSSTTSSTSEPAVTSSRTDVPELPPTAVASGSAGPLPAGQGCPSTMVPIVPKGPVWIGSKDGVGYDDEHPRYSVTLKPYCMDTTEVTVAAYAKCAGEKKCAAAPTPYGACNGNKADKQGHPVNCVTWDEADKYCQSTGGRLPSEEEWEFAARGPDERVYPWGSTPAPSNQLCWDGEGSDLGKGKRYSTCPVASYPKGDSPFGLSDMAGNVWEWTSSNYCPYLQSKNCSDPRRVVRGGSWNFDVASSVRAAYRGYFTPTARNFNIGFRCARDM